MSMGKDGLNPRMLRELPEFLALDKEESHGVQQGEMQNPVSGEESPQVPGMAGDELDRKQLSREGSCSPGGEQMDREVAMNACGKTDKGGIRKSVASRSREAQRPVSSPLVRSGCCMQFSVPQWKKDMDFVEQDQCRDTKILTGLEHPSYEERRREMGVFSQDAIMHRGLSQMCINR